MTLFKSSSTINFRNAKCPMTLPHLGSPTSSFDLSFLRLWQPSQYHDNDSKKAANGAHCSEEHSAIRRRGGDGHTVGRSLLLAGRQHSLSSRGSVIAERPHQAKPSPVLPKQDFICRGPATAKWFGKSSIFKMRFRCYFLSPYSNTFKWKL